MVFSRLFRSIFIGIAITLLLTAIELAMIWFFNPINILGDKRADIFSILVALPMHLPLLLLIPFVELVATALVAFLAARPLALRAYLRDVQKEQEAYRKTYTQLDSLAQMYKTPVTYFEHTPDPQLPGFGQTVSLLDLVELPQEISLLLEGAAGTGKTLTLEQYRFFALQQRKALLRGQNSIPVYLPLKNYSAFIKSHLERHHLIVAEAGGEVVGLLAYRTDWFQCTFVSLVVVREDFRRRGIAREFFRSVEAVSPTPRIFSSTEETNAAAIRMHTALGFTPSGYVDNLPQGTRELLFYRRVPPRLGSVG